MLKWKPDEKSVGRQFFSSKDGTEIIERLVSCFSSVASERGRGRKNSKMNERTEEGKEGIRCDQLHKRKKNNIASDFKETNTQRCRELLSTSGQLK